jgi:hypothetical protein
VQSTPGEQAGSTGPRLPGAVSAVCGAAHMSCCVVRESCCRVPLALSGCVPSHPPFALVPSSMFLAEHDHLHSRLASTVLSLQAHLVRF